MSESEQCQPAADAVSVAPTNMTDAETHLRKILHAIARDNNYLNGEIDVKPISSGGGNYTSVLFHATISSPDLPDLKLFAKVGCVGENFRTKFDADNFFKTEQVFYNRLIKTWDRFQEKYQIPEEHRFVVPKFYGIPEEGSETVVMEDLGAAGYGTYDRFRSVDWETASKSIELMAKFHALSYVHAKEDPVEFDELLGELKFSIMLENQEEGLKDMWQQMLDRSVSVVDEKHQEKVRKFFNGSFHMDMFKEYNKPTHAPILAHGDFRTSNMLYKRQDGVIKPIVLDFQTIHCGCPATDLLYFIFLGSDEEFRKRHYHQLVEHYYSELGAALDRYQMDVAYVYPREHFDDDLEKMMPYAMVLGLSVLPVVTVETENAPSMGDDKDLDSFLMPSNDLYAQRFNGIVNDMVRSGAI